jgi:hypothetical protein
VDKVDVEPPPIVFPTITHKAPGSFDLDLDRKVTRLMDDHIPGAGWQDDDVDGTRATRTTLMGSKSKSPFCTSEATNV